MTLKKILKNALTKQFITYLAVGVLNTIVGFGIIALLLFLKIMPEIANLLGYIAGICISFILNRIFTFKDDKKPLKIELQRFLKFSLCMGAAYIINLLVFIICYRFLGINVYIALIISSGFYTLSGYIFSKLYAFR